MTIYYHCPKHSYGFEKEGYCQYCGAKRVPLQTCSGCGTQIRPGFEFCEVCGQSQKKDQEIKSAYLTFWQNLFKFFKF